MFRKRVFIVGGGPSLSGFNFSRLKYEDTIAVNMSALDVPQPTYCITADSSIFRKVQEGHFASVSTTWVLVTNPNHCTMKYIDGKFINVKDQYVYNTFCANIVIRNADVDGIGLEFKDFKTGYNSGFCAFQLAVLLGYKEIYLLGMDLTTANRKCHYHDRYGGRIIKDATLDKFYQNFVKSFAILKQNHVPVEVVSCSNISLLNNHIPYKSFDEVMAP